MKRRVFAIFAALAVLLSVAVVTMWVRSHIVTDRLQWQGYRLRMTSIQIESGRGWIGARWQGSLLLEKPLAPEVIEKIDAQRKTKPAWYAFHRTRWAEYPFGATSPGLSNEVMVPYGAVVVVMMMPMALWYWQRRRRQRAITGFCPTCNYDLRATPHKCPECGSEPTPFPARPTPLT